MSNEQPDAPARWHPETLAVTSGRPGHQIDAPLNPPVVFNSTYVAAHDTSGPEIAYGRYGNPTWSALETAIGALEGGRALAYSSGMAAVSAVLELMPSHGVLVLPTSCYLGVVSVATERAEKYGWTVRRVDVADTDLVLAAAEGADLVWLESPTNPLMEVADLPAIGAALHGRVRLVVDSTFATPLRQQPLAFGFDIVLHSVTKFIAGHSDVLLGAVVTASEDEQTYAALKAVRSGTGAIPGSMEAYLALRGLRTLALRIRQADASALVLAERLAAQPAVQRVRFPGLPGDPGHDRAARVMAGFGSLLSIELADGPSAERFIDGAELWTHATSLGGVDSLFERRRRWAGESPDVPEGLVRLSVGIEHVEDLWADLEQSLDRLAG
jgi:cystathionine gamma-synthase